MKDNQTKPLSHEDQLKTTETETFHKIKENSLSYELLNESAHDLFRVEWCFFFFIFFAEF